MLGFSLSQASVVDPKKLQHRHRANVRARFLNGGAQAIADFELLELVIFRAIPHRDVRPLCKLLLRQFGSFGNVITAPQSDLKKIAGIGQAANLSRIKVSDIKERDAASESDAQDAAAGSRGGEKAATHFNVMAETSA